MNFIYYNKYTDSKNVTCLKASATTKYRRQTLTKKEPYAVYDSIKIIVMRSFSHHSN
jgi:hypothetical protein